MKSGWEMKRLGNICDFEGGSQPPKLKFVDAARPGYVRFLQIRDFAGDKHLTFIPKSSKNRVCDEKDILIARYGASVGKIVTGKAGAYNVALVRTIPDLSVLDRTWFYHYLTSDEFQRPLMNVAARSAQDGFSKPDIHAFPVYVPPLSEQQRIVRILDQAFDAIGTAKATAEKNLQNARALSESYFQSTCRRHGRGWTKKRLGEIAETISTGPFGTMLHKSDYVPGGIPLVTRRISWTHGSCRCKV